VVETNTFGGSGIVLGEFDLKDRVAEINIAAAKLAKEVAAQFSTKDKPRFVAGSMGPTTKLPSLGHITYEQMLDTFVEQALALIEGGVDLLLVETCQDLLQAKIATIASLDAMRKAGTWLPLPVQVTVQDSGVMLLGTEIGAAVTALELLDLNILGLNCATGPAEMNDAVRYLGANSTRGLGSAQRWPARERRGSCRIQADAGGAGQIPRALRPGLWSARGRWMLWNYSRAP